ncbi:MAG: NAD(P)H-dependent oxidoreductase [Clostridiales Family XIII bacterium]|jgi:chromate reductase|nr:NAD(P)H-dependent oxidoreductase [Clostridiales Family XIII bacterium]
MPAKTELKIGVFRGSLRKGSYSGAVADFIAAAMPNGFDAEIVDIGQLTMFNQGYDDDGTTPKEWTAFRGKVAGLDGCLFVTPEYNRSIPPVLKNALDIASRPQGKNVWSGKPGAVVSVSPGKSGGMAANHQLRQALICINVPVMQQPEAYISGAADIVKNGVVDESERAFLTAFANAFADWVKLFVKTAE